MRTLTILGLALAVTAANAEVIIGNLPSNDGTQAAGVSTLRMKALGFTMGGSNYFLQSITLRLAFTASWVDNNPVVTLRAAGANATTPGEVIETLSGPGGYSANTVGDFTFNSVANTELLANTLYYVHVAGSPNATVTTGLDWKASSPAVTPTGPGATHTSSLFTSNGGTTHTNSSILNSYEINANPVPEPGTIAALGLGALVLLRRRNRK